MWKSAGVLCLLLQFLHCTYSQELNDGSRLQFAVDVGRTIGPKFLTENVILSPVSLQTVLALTSLGARGETAAELIKGLHLEGYPSKDLLAEEYGSFLDLIKKDGGKVQMANRIYVSSKYDVAPRFNTYGEKYFGATAEKVDFIEKEKAAAKVNGWVEEQTHDKIKNLLSPDALDEDTVVLLVNALYFKADWRNKFQPVLTADHDFWVNENDKVVVPMMKSHKAQSMRYCQSTTMDATAVELPYESTNLKMVIVLPNKKGDFPQMQQKLSTENFKQFLLSCRFENVIVSLPKFKIETTVDLKEHLQNMGMTNIFSDKADFSQMLETDKPLSITDVKQKIYINVDENGSEAAAATYVLGATRMGFELAPEPIIFTADHPFAFLIKDDHAIYFAGHVVHPGLN